VSDAQDQAEGLDDDKLDDDEGYGYSETSADFPPDQPSAVSDYGVTDREAALDEPFVERDRRYEPDPLVDELERDEATEATGDEPSTTAPAEEAAVHVVNEDQI
jgi:hypothetical protein